MGIFFVSPPPPPRPHISNGFVIVCCKIIHCIVFNFATIIVVLILTNSPFSFYFIEIYNSLPPHVLPNFFNPPDLVTVTKVILNRKHHLLCSIWAYIFPVYLSHIVMGHLLIYKQTVWATLPTHHQQMFFWLQKNWHYAFFLQNQYFFRNMDFIFPN